MEGKRWKTGAVAAVLAAVGCQSSGSKDLTSGTPAPPAAAPGGNAVSRMFQPKPPGPVKQPVEVVDGSRKNKPLAAETRVAFANAQVESAFDFQSEGKTEEVNRAADEARMKYQKVLEGDPKNKEALQGLARLYTRLGDREHAVATMQTVIKYYPQDHKSAYELALVHARFEDWGGAVQACQKALAGDVENRRYQKTLGILVARTGELAKGFDLMARVMPEAEARYTMAKLLVDMDRPDLAQQQLQLALTADPNFLPAKEWLASQNATPPGAVQTVEHREPAGN